VYVGEKQAAVINILFIAVMDFAYGADIEGSAVL
jgi:hypothetical protein